MKKSNGYLMKQLEDEWILLPVGEKTEAVHEVLSLSETAGFIYGHAEEAETIEQLALLGKKALNLKQNGRIGSSQSHKKERI